MNIDSLLNSMWSNYSSAKKNANNNSVSKNIDENIFAQASSLVAEYKQALSEKKNNSASEKSNFCGLNAFQMANMSTKDLLNYAYNNEAFSIENKEDSSGVELPSLIFYGAITVSTVGKTFMSVVSELHAKYPFDSEEEIAATLMAEHGISADNALASKNSNNATEKNTGNKINFSG